MLNSGPHLESKCASFCRNVEYVEYVLGELEGDPWPENSTYSTFQQKEAHFLRKCASSRGNVEYVEFWGPMLNQNVLLSAEMLNMLNMLNVLGEIRR